MTVFTPLMVGTLRAGRAEGRKFKDICTELGIKTSSARRKASRIGVTVPFAARKPYRLLGLNESVEGLTKGQVRRWIKYARRDGLKLKRFLKGNLFGLRRIA